MIFLKLFSSWGPGKMHTHTHTQALTVDGWDLICKNTFFWNSTAGYN